MSQVEKPEKGKIYIAKIQSSGRVWIFESDYHEEKGRYTEAMGAYCYDCNGTLSLQDRFVSGYCTVIKENTDIKWMRLASDSEALLFKLINEERRYC